MGNAQVPTFFLKKGSTVDFLKALAKHRSVYVPQRANDVIHYTLFDPEKKQDIVIEGTHATEPLKTFFFPAHEIVGTYFSSKPKDDAANQRAIAIVGVKSYDLHSLKLLDKILGEGEFLDETYVNKRKNALIIASDCTDLTKACFSPLVDIKLYPEENFDLSLARVRGGYVVTIGSDNGKAVIDENLDLFLEVPDEKIHERDEKRRQLQKQAEEHSAEFKIDCPYEELLRKEIDSPVWLDATKTCVECGACVLVCPTCYCFVLADKKTQDGYQRRRTWDTCQYAGFARVAGGGNPRPRLAERLRHRYMHKFDYLKESYDFYACTGCGRCIQACMGKIDMRKVFVELAGAAAEVKK